MLHILSQEQKRKGNGLVTESDERN